VPRCRSHYEISQTRRKSDVILNWELTAPWQGAQIHQPSLFIAGSKDSVITGLIGAIRVDDMERVLPSLKQKLIIEGAGHWVQQECAAEVNVALIAFLKDNAR
jgi:pimeloyl-ACP methyl ester carboxylesterase